MPIIRKRKANFRPRRRVKRVRWPTTTQNRRMVVARNLRPFRLNVVRKICSSTPLTFGTAATEQFYKYCTVSLQNGFSTFSATPTTICNLTNLTEYSSLFEQYRLNAFKIELIPRYQNFQTDQNAGTATVRNIPMVYICKDSGNASTYSGTWQPLFLNGLLENGGRTYRGDRKITIFMKPRVSEQYGAGANRYVKPQWTDLTTTAGQQMAHRGFHMFVYSNTWDNASFPVFDVFVTYYLQFRNPR